MDMRLENELRMYPMAIVFGRPGSGKTTISEAALLKIGQGGLKNNDSFDCFGLDLDVCVPQWMKDNFGKGIYPTLQQRTEFATSACDYVETRFAERRLANVQLSSEKEINRKKTTTSQLIAIVSFSFVNTDLRKVFQSRFPHATWILIDTDEEEALRRINEREGHFYKGKPIDKNSQKKKGFVGTDEIKEEDTSSSSNPPDVDNSDWVFAPVDFDHVVMNGKDPVAKNVDVLLEAVQKQSAST